MKWKSTIVLLFVISAVLGGGFSAFARSRSEGIGDFDIAKVRRASGVRSATAGKNVIQSSVANPGLSKIAIRMIVSLGAIMLLLAAVMYGFRKLAGQRGPINARSGMLDVLETASIMPGRSLSLVRASDRVLLLGISQEGIRCLSEFSGEGAVEIIEATDKGNFPKPLTQFSDSLNGFLDKFKGKAE